MICHRSLPRLADQHLTVFIKLDLGHCWLNASNIYKIVYPFFTKHRFPRAAIVHTFGIWPCRQVSSESGHQCLAWFDGDPVALVAFVKV